MGFQGDAVGVTLHDTQRALNHVDPGVRARQLGTVPERDGATVLGPDHCGVDVTALVLAGVTQSGVSHHKGGQYTYYADFTSEQGPQLTYFGDAKVVSEVMSESDSVTSYKQYFDGATTNVTVNSAYTDNGAVVTGAPSSSAAHLYVYGTKTTGTMGPQTAKFVGDELGGSADDWLYHGSTQVSTPIHTSSHYQAFETPWLHELVGGDRNMEQTNLVVTDDGKTWDQVTRDTSYIGNMVVQLDTDATYAYDSDVIFDEARGSEHIWNWGWKDSWVLAYDRLICLKDGFYNWHLLCETAGTGNSAYVQVRINDMGVAHIMPGNDSSISSSATRYFKKGDYLQIMGVFGRNSPSYSIFQLEKARP